MRSAASILAVFILFTSVPALSEHTLLWMYRETKGYSIEKIFLEKKNPIKGDFIRIFSKNRQDSFSNVYYYIKSQEIKAEFYHAATTSPPTSFPHELPADVLISPDGRRFARPNGNVIEIGHVNYSFDCLPHLDDTILLHTIELVGVSYQNLFSPDGQFLFSVSAPSEALTRKKEINSLVLTDFSNMYKETELFSNPNQEKGFIFNGALFSPDSTWISAIWKKNNTYFISLTTTASAPTQEIITSEEPVEQFSFSPDSQYFVWANKTTLVIRNVATQYSYKINRLMDLKTEKASTQTFYFSPDSHYLLSILENKEEIQKSDICLIDLKTHGVKKMSYNLEFPFVRETLGSVFHELRRTKTLFPFLEFSPDQEFGVIKNDHFIHDFQPLSLITIPESQLFHISLDSNLRGYQFNAASTLLALHTDSGIVQVWSLDNVW